MVRECGIGEKNLPEQNYTTHSREVLVETCFHSVCAFAAVVECRRCLCTSHSLPLPRFFLLFLIILIFSSIAKQNSQKFLFLGGKWQCHHHHQHHIFHTEENSFSKALHLKKYEEMKRMKINLRHACTFHNFYSSLRA